MPYVTEENPDRDRVVERWSNVPDPRLQINHADIAELAPSCMGARHRAVPRWGVVYRNRFTLTAARESLCTDKRQWWKFILLVPTASGVSMLVDAINHRLSNKATPTTVTGSVLITSTTRRRSKTWREYGWRRAGASHVSFRARYRISTGVKPPGNASNSDIWHDRWRGPAGWRPQVEDTRRLGACG